MVALRRALTRVHRDDAGISLIEMMAALLILGVALSALASSLITSLQTTSRNEQEITATAAAQQIVEQLQAVDWEITALYEDDVTTSTTQAWTGLDAAARSAWLSRIDAPDGTAAAPCDTEYCLGGEPLATIPGGATASTRDGDVPLPRTVVTINSTDFTVDTYPLSIDRDNDGTRDTRRFVTHVTWTDRFGNLKEIQFEAERAPTREEAQASVEVMRVMYFYMTPNVHFLGLDEKPTTAMDVLITTSRPVSVGTATLTWEWLEITKDAVTGTVTTAVRTASQTMTNDGVATLDGFTGATTWRTTIDTSRTHGNGTVSFSFTGDDANPDATLPDAEAVRTVEFRNGTYPHANATYAAGVVPSEPTFVVPPSTITADALVKGSSTLCVDNSSRVVTKEFNLTIRINNLQMVTDPDDSTATIPNGNVYVTYTRRATKYSTQTTAERLSADFVKATTSTKTEWLLTVPVNSGFWLPGDQLDFIIQVEHLNLTDPNNRINNGVREIREDTGDTTLPVSGSCP